VLPAAIGDWHRRSRGRLQRRSRSAVRGAR
jgi:hypothetical protein